MAFDVAEPAFDAGAAAEGGDPGAAAPVVALPGFGVDVAGEGDGALGAAGRGVVGGWVADFGGGRAVAAGRVCEGAADFAGAGGAFVAFFAAVVGAGDAAEGPLFAAVDVGDEVVEGGGVGEAVGAFDGVEAGGGGGAVGDAGDDAGAVVAALGSVLGGVQVEDGVDAEGVEAWAPVEFVGVAAVGDDFADRSSVADEAVRVGRTAVTQLVEAGTTTMRSARQGSRWRVWPVLPMRTRACSS